MPSPSKFSLVLALAATGGIFYGGAWFASGLKGEANAAAPSQTERENYVPALIPGMKKEPSSGGARLEIWSMDVQQCIQDRRLNYSASWLANANSRKMTS